MSAAPALAALQADFHAWLAHGDAAAGARLGPAAGLAVYRHNHRSALAASLAASHPRVQLWLGEDDFAAAAERYAAAHPPHGWTLDAYGADFAALLAGLYPDDDEVAELGRLDWALGQAFVAADAAPCPAARLGTVDWERAVLRFVPSLHVLMLRSNADAIWLALAAEETPPQPETAEDPATVLVWRQGFETVLRRIDRDEARMLALAQAGESFPAICADLAETLGEEGAVAAAGAVLGRWIAEELIAAID